MASAQDQMTPVGKWQTVDDQTGALKSLIDLRQVNGVISGRVVAIYSESAPEQQRCTKCTDDRKNQPIIGMEIIRGARQVDGENRWSGGVILDPEEGKEYSLRMMPIEGGNKLQVRGSFGFLYRTQIWTRAVASSPQNTPSHP